MLKSGYALLFFFAILTPLAQPPAWADAAGTLFSSSCPSNNSSTLTCTWKANTTANSNCLQSQQLNGGSCTSDGKGVFSVDGTTLSFCKQQVTIDQNCTKVTTPDPFDHSPVGGGGSPNTCLGGSGDPGSDSGGSEYAPTCSPIILDVGEEGFHLTSAQDGVSFDITGTGHSVQLAWTDPHFRNAFLALPGPDGLVHNGKELFGNFTPQPPSNHPNGFLALAEYDKPENGGNGDGIIDEHDTVYSRLRLWIDENHDGLCQPNELHTLSDLGVSSISLMYHPSRKEDQYGNIFRYRARVNPIPPDDQAEVGKTAYDVFLTVVK